MGKRPSQNTAFGLGDYDQPTEPLETIALPAYAAPTYTVDDPYPYLGPQTVPAPQPGTRPFPQGSSSTYPVYPVLPAIPIKKYRGHPPGGSPPINQPVRRTKRRYKPLSRLVNLLFMLVQLALLARVVCMVLNVLATNVWLNLFFWACDLLAWPLRLLAASLTIPWLQGTQLLIYLELLLAILLYGLVARIVVGFLRVLFLLW
jgi:hypothetical protein